MPLLNKALFFSALALTSGLLGCKDRSAEQLAKAQEEARDKSETAQLFYDEPDFIKKLPDYKERNGSSDTQVG